MPTPRYVSSRTCKRAGSVVKITVFATAGVLVIASALLARGPKIHARAAEAPALAMYHNPILMADYSDPDVIRDGDDFYLIASTFHFVPGIPILHSRDLVHWEIIGHAVDRLTMSPAYDMKGGTRYAGGIWAPAVRFHNGVFYIYFPTPDEGIFVVTSRSMKGPWSKPKVVIAGPGYEDPCPFWDEDGRAYLVHSRLGAGPLILHRLSADGTQVLDAGKVIVQDPKELPTLEGPKFYKRNGWYYIFAPFGGVATGAQAVLRARNIYGPYEHRTVLAQGNTPVNGPHQGGYVETPDGRGWFLHFQFLGAHGRVVHLEPVRWVDDWPVIGRAADGELRGEPVVQGPVPVANATGARLSPQTSDEFDGSTLSPMWEWNHNPANSRWSLTQRPGFLRLHSAYSPDLLHARNTLTECMQDESLDFTVRFDIAGMQDGDRTGVSVFDKSQSYIAVEQLAGGQRRIIFADRGAQTPGVPFAGSLIQLRARVEGDTATYAYSLDDGRSFQPLGHPVKLGFSWWKGARPAIFAFNTDPNAKRMGAVDLDWAHYRPISKRSFPVQLVSR